MSARSQGMRLPGYVAGTQRSSKPREGHDMAQRVREVMTANPASLPGDATAREAARQMRDNDTGAMLVVDGNDLRGIVTDRDIVVRAVAEGIDPDECRVGDICTAGVTTVSPDQPVEEAIRIVREQ